MHSFSRFIQILGKGKNGMRPLSQEEAYEAMRMITCYDVEPEQLGAFLMLMRVKEETAEEVAGFTQALRESIPTSDKWFRPAIDWAAYAGKKKQLPWFLLSALILAGRGHPVLMHGMQRDDERIYVPEALDALGIEIADSLNHAEQQLKASGFSYLPVSTLSTLTNELISTRELFGLRPPLHTVARMLNPFHAPLSVMGVFHPNFATIHQQAAQLLGQPRALICKGEGGEFERIPERSSILYGMTDNHVWTETWNNLLKPGSLIKPEQLNLNHFRSVWDGDIQDDYAELAITGTLAWVIRAMQIETTPDSVHLLAKQWWQQRHEHGCRSSCDI
ncbi:MAG: glycosyl transferase family protein [gamma proteobacterium symbiont of Bathyaustriella thionipta]|nr:glycosyl transferase family protein [gamma proteobacterium symbiont of Bathyaustriella thionipta]MCU7951674.1 glycosyl transferase family protein [gamma proteobacterium symbiont of Bathyaustriella thionipta]MCU7954052.1 glycosyl transferase family protein [gamma proteobacterium symbiont of Bathyaustriella thionipta]MCU7958271.1 glycosyl transferase family protein [gamma proteobacterium symbiont of Bathyaustriella thionipta]MCU7968213.1 glycosyl transferase family protein [gamma proteobacteri